MSRLIRLGVPVTFLAAVATFLGDLLFSNRILARGDVLLYFYPYWTAAAASLRAGELPLWNPHLFLGVPFLANSQAGVLYPLNWPLWLLWPAPQALELSAALHLLIAATGTYLAGRRALDLGRAPAVLAGLLYALSGPVPAQIEHINQLQALAWLPWLVAVLDGSARRPWRRMAAVAVLLALQLLAGHTQTLFISVVGLAVWLAARWWLERRAGAGDWRPLATLAGGGLLALALSAGQLLPTLELTALSSRQGGLPLAETLSFSWSPLLVTRSLLPGYGQSLFTEYVAGLPLTAWLLVAVGLVAGLRDRDRAVLALLALALLGFGLALGAYNPLYWLLGRLPGFDLFRVPARWLAWSGLALALLAGRGWQSWQLGARPSRRLWLVATAALALLMAWGWPAAALAAVVPFGPEVAPETPSLATVGGWAAELAIVWWLWWLARRRTRPALLALMPLAIIFAYLDGRDLPARQPTAPLAYEGLRPPAAFLKSVADCRLPERACPPVPARFLSLSDITFDVGDAPELAPIFAATLSSRARFDLTVALKQQEIVGPNLPLAYGLYAADGFDGGLLPLAAYQRLASALLPSGEAAPDGRLRERLASVPPARWLDLLAVGHVITDKTGDVWRRGVYFDRQFSAVALPDAPLAVDVVPDLPANALWLLTAGPVGVIELALSDGRSMALTPAPIEDGLSAVTWPGVSTVAAITVTTATAAWPIEALSLVNTEAGTFQSLVPAAWRLVQSGDVKVYERLSPPARVAWLGAWEWADTADEALDRLADPGFDLSTTAVLTGNERGRYPDVPWDGRTGEARLMAFDPTTVVVRTDGSASGVLLLKEAAYPGWQAFIDGQPASIATADVVYRAVFVPAGDHEVVFQFRPISVVVGLVVSLASWLGLGIGLLVAEWRARGRGL